MKPTTRSASRRNSTAERSSQLAVADSSSPSSTRDEEPSTRPDASLLDSETGEPQSPSQSDMVDTPSKSRAGFKKPSTRSATSLCNSEVGQPQSPSQSDIVDSPCRSRARFEKPTTRSASKHNSQNGQLAVADSQSEPRTREDEIALDGFSLAEEEYLKIDTQVKVEFPTIHNLLEDSEDSVISLESCHKRGLTVENTVYSKETTDPRQSCGSVVQIFNCSNTKNRSNNDNQYNSDWESDQESDHLKLEPDANLSDVETTSSREEVVSTVYQNLEDDLRLSLKEEEEAPLRNHEENEISSIEIIENPLYKEEELGNYNNASTDDLNIHTRETFLTRDAMKPGDNCDSRDHSSEVISFKSICSPKSDNNFDVRSDSQEYILASENACGENDSRTMHLCDASCEVSGRCVIKAHNSLYGPSFVSLSPKYLNILNSVPEKNERGDVSKNINLSSVSNNSWDPDQDKKNCISGISTMSFSENGFTIDAVNESITLSDSENEIEPREWWNVSDNKSKAIMNPSSPVDSDSEARISNFKETTRGYCKKCAPPHSLVEDILGNLSSVFHYFYSDFFCLCKSNSKLCTENSVIFNKMNTAVAILNSVNSKYVVGILAFLVYGRSPDLIKELELNIKNNTSKKRGRPKKKKKLVLKDEINGSYVLYEKNNKFSNVEGESTSYERVINLDRVVLGTKRKVRVPDSEVNLTKNIISPKVNGIKKRRQVKKVVGKLIHDTSWERVTTLDKVAQGTEEEVWIPADDCESSPRLSPDEIHTNPKPRYIRRSRKVKDGDHKKLNFEGNILMCDDDLSPSTSPSFPGFNTMEIPAAENVIDVWKESINPLLDYCPGFKGFTGVAGKKSTKKKSIFIDWMESTSKSNGFVT